MDPLGSCDFLGVIKIPEQMAETGYTQFIQLGIGQIERLVNYLEEMNSS